MPVTAEESRPARLTALALLGGRAGLPVIALGFLVIFLGWNGAAGYDRVPSQMPYVISGGLGGLALVVVGAVLLVVEQQRRNRVAIEAALAELRRALAEPVRPGPAPGDGRGPADLVVAGSFDYAPPGSRLTEGRTDLPLVPRAEAEAAGLTPARSAGAPPAPATTGGDEGGTGRPRRRLRAD